MIDPRRGVPSASKMHRVANCPASHQMEQLAERRENKDAAAGTLTHDVLAGEVSADEVPHSVAETAEMCEEQAQRLVAEYFGDEPVTEYKELRYGLTRLGGVVVVTDECKADIVFTGQYDRLYVSGERGLLLDFKALFGNHPKAQENPQLASLAVLAGQKHKLQSLRVAIVQPWKGKPTICDYQPSDLGAALRWLWDALDRERKATPSDRKAGDWCNNCAARAGCEVFKNQAVNQLEVIEPLTISSLDGEQQRRAMFARAIELPAAKLAGAVRGLEMVKRYLEAIEGAARDRAENDPEFQRFFILHQKKGKRSISDVETVWVRCASEGITAADFTAECSIGLGAVKDLLKKATGAKGKALDALTDTVLSGAVETGKGSFELVPSTLIEDTL